MTKKELLEAIENIPENATIEFYDARLMAGSGYAKIYNVYYIEKENIIELS